MFKARLPHVSTRERSHFLGHTATAIVYTLTDHARSYVLYTSSTPFCWLPCISSPHMNVHIYFPDYNSQYFLSTLACSHLRLVKASPPPQSPPASPLQPPPAAPRTAKLHLMYRRFYRHQDGGEKRWSNRTPARGKMSESIKRRPLDHDWEATQGPESKNIV